MKSNFIGYEVIDHEVREVLEIITQSGQKVINRPQSKEYRFYKHIKLNKEDNVVAISIQDYLGNPLPYEPISIRITGESALGEALEPFEGICEDGEIDLSGYVAGDKITVQTMSENVENAKLEVVI